MEDLRARFDGLSLPQRKRVHNLLCSQALKVWREFATRTEQLTYSDSIVGLSHTLEWNLPDEAFAAAFANEQKSDHIRDIAERYLEPIAALQDDDLQLPEAILFAYYAIYNAFSKYAQNATTDDWIIVNQALSVSPAEARSNLKNAIAEAERCL